MFCSIANPRARSVGTSIFEFNYRFRLISIGSR